VAFWPITALFQFPAVQNIAIQNQPVATGIFEEVIYLVDLAVVRTEVDIGDDDGFYSEWFLVHR
jgi:hypothetical protein